MCGICGALDTPDAAALVKKGLQGNQNRARYSAGIVSTDGASMYQEARLGIAKLVFTKSIVKKLHGTSALGHVRYSTNSDDPTRDNTQPIVGNWKGMPFALAHNGNLTNQDELAKLVPRRSTSMDTEYIVRMIEASDAGNIKAAILDVLKKLRGSFELGILLPDRLIAIRDPEGNHPLVIGRREDGSYVISSETSALPLVDADFVQEVEPGTMVVMDKGHLSVTRFAPANEKKCIFELIYYSMPTSRTFGIPVRQFRRGLGRALEKYCPTLGADLAFAVPDSATLIAEGYGESGRSGVYASGAILRYHEAERNFIGEDQESREGEIDFKFSYDQWAIEDQKAVLVDDSLVRGTTSRAISKKLRRMKIKEIHYRFACPPILHPCTYGINTRKHDELIMNRMDVAKLCGFLEADSVEFLPLEILKQMSPVPPKERIKEGEGVPWGDVPSRYCFACMDGKYW